MCKFTVMIYVIYLRYIHFPTNLSFFLFIPLFVGYVGISKISAYGIFNGNTQY